MERKNIIGGSNISFTELYEIRPKKIKEALLWLKLYNPFYKDIILYFDELEDWAQEIFLYLHHN